MALVYLLCYLDFCRRMVCTKTVAGGKIQRVAGLGGSFGGSKPVASPGAPRVLFQATVWPLTAPIPPMLNLSRIR